MEVQVRKRGGEDALAGEGKRRKSVKKQPGYKPPIPQLNSSDTPPDDDPVDMLDLPPPPPSERKIARRRPSVRAAARAFTPEPDSPSAAKRHKPFSASSSQPVKPVSRGRAENAEAGASSQPLPSMGASLLGGSVSSSSRIPGLPRPLSPPLALGASITARRKSSMGPPLEPFVRKTRKSMSRMGMLPADISDEREVPLPDSETPMIKKNKQLREEQSRRSSLGLRGQRASSSLGRGEVSIPHPTVDSAHFYKHIAPSLPEPIRCRHLLVFTAKRSVDDHLAEGKSKGKSRDKGKNRYQGERTEEGDRLVKDIMDAFLARLGKGEVETNVFSTSGATTAGLSLRPHPQNVLNREQEAKAESVIRREKSTWRAIKARTRKRQEEVISALKAKALSAPSADMPDLNDMEDWMVEALEMADGVIGEGLGDLADKGEFSDVEFKVDMLHQSTHAALQYSLQATRFLDGIFSTLASDLRSRDPSKSGRSTETDGPDSASLLAAATTSTVPSTSASSSRVNPRSDPINMLRALAAAEQKEQNEAGVAAAKRIQPVSAASMGMSLGVSTSTAPNAGLSVAQTPRRAGQTPRRVGALSASTAGPGGTAGASGVRGRIYGKGAEAAAE